MISRGRFRRNRTDPVRSPTGIPEQDLFGRHGDQQGNDRKRTGHFLSLIRTAGQITNGGMPHKNVRHKQHHRQHGRRHIVYLFMSVRMFLVRVLVRQSAPDDHNVPADLIKRGMDAVADQHLNRR